MPRSTPTALVPSYAGTLVGPAAPDALGDIVPAGRVSLVVACGATPTTVSILTPTTVEGLPVGDAGGTVAANTTRVFGPFPARLFAQASDAPVGAGQVLVDYSSIATVTRYLLST